MAQSGRVQSSILVTGGAGFIGSHTCVELLEAGYHVVIIDNFETSFPSSVTKISEVTGYPIEIENGDIRDESFLDSVMDAYNFSGVIHFAGLKSVGVSVGDPLRYYEYNLVGTVDLLKAMSRHNLKTIVFSSSAAVYGEPEHLPLTEDHSLAALSPYGRTKAAAEGVLKDLKDSDSDWRIAILRYFNPIGAHKSGLLGECSKDISNNLMSNILRVAAGKQANLEVWGIDYGTPDGTGIRDYVHVVDLAKGHVLALQKLEEINYLEINLGTGQGYSVREVVRTFEHVSNCHIPLDHHGRRRGDVPVCYADPTRAHELLGWKAVRNLREMCEDVWNYHVKSSNSSACSHFAELKDPALK